MLRIVLAFLLFLLLLPTTARAGLIIKPTFDSSPNWTDAAKAVALDAVSEWMYFYCTPITINVKFTWHDFGNTNWGETSNFTEDATTHLPTGADVELNTRLLSEYYFDATPGDITDDAGKLKASGDSSIDAASVLKHELFHAIGFARGNSKFSDKQREDGDLDGDGKNEYYLDYNGSTTYDAGELVLSDNGTEHTDDGFYNKGESSLMGYPGFGRGQQARPSVLEVNALHDLDGYSVHPEPPTFVLVGIAGLLIVVARVRRRRRPV